MARRRDKTTSEDVCSDCGSSNIIHDTESGEIICGNCGLVITQSTINKGPEWRAFTQSEKESRSRVGVPLSFSVHDKGLTTMIGRVGRDAFGRKIPLKTKLQMLRLRKWQIRSRVHSSVDRNLAQAMAELDRQTPHPPTHQGEGSRHLQKSTGQRPSQRKINLSHRSRLTLRRM